MLRIGHLIQLKFSFSHAGDDAIMTDDNPEFPKDLSRAMAKFAPKTMKDLVFEQLKSAIITGQLKPGQRLVEHRLAPLLQVSRTPIREALSLLEQERLVERLPQGGVRVTLISVKEMQQLNEIRCLLEVYSAEKAAHNVASGNISSETQPFLDALRSLPLEMHNKLENEDVIELLALGNTFHAAIHELAANPIGTGVLRQVIGAMERYRALVPPTRTITTVEEHAAIAKAILSGDPLEASTLMREHVAKAGSHYSETIQAIQRSGDTQ